MLHIIANLSLRTMLQRYIKFRIHVFQMLVIFLALAIASSAAAENWARYHPSTLESSTSQHAATGKGSIIVEETAIKSHVLHQNSSRPISQKKKALIKAWITRYSLSKKYLASFEREIKVFEQSKEYWIPIQKQLQYDLWENFRRFPAYIDIYVVLIGFVDSEPVFLLNRYDEYLEEEKSNRGAARGQD